MEEIEKNKYTQEEIIRNIDFFESKKESLENQRKEINKEIRLTKESIEYWNNLDISQLRMFK